VAEQGAYIVPTMAVIFAFHEDGAAHGLPAASVRKIGEVVGHALSGMERMKKAGCKIGFGSDLLGPQHTRHGTEFTLRKSVFTPVEILRQATSMNAEILKRSGEIGCVRVGARADLIAVRGNPLEDIDLLAAQGRHLSLIMRDGVVYKNENR
jgi:imidazolonepropionase-like amidohydrolase